jgi:hypothetical protein
MILASLFVIFHLLTIVILVLSAPSGPWPTPFGPSPALGPPFAGTIANVTTRYYLEPLQMTHNYHFTGNHPDQGDIAFEVGLKDADGRLMETVRFPSPRANSWVRQRQVALAQNLGDDEPVQTPRGDMLPAPGQKMPMMKIWDMAGPNKLVVREVPIHLIAKDRPVSRPREWSLLLARSYMRHLCRQYGAASAELKRISRQPVMPALLYAEEVPPGTFDTLESTFEEYHRDK